MVSGCARGGRYRGPLPANRRCARAARPGDLSFCPILPSHLWLRAVRKESRPAGAVCPPAPPVVPPRAPDPAVECPVPRRPGRPLPGLRHAAAPFPPPPGPGGGRSGWGCPAEGGGGPAGAAAGRGGLAELQGPRWRKPEVWGV